MSYYKPNTQEDEVTEPSDPGGRAPLSGLGKARPEDRAGRADGEVGSVTSSSEPKLRVFFNPFRFTIEQNNEFLAKGYEVMPLRIPDGR